MSVLADGGAVKRPAKKLKMPTATAAAMASQA